MATLQRASLVTFSAVLWIVVAAAISVTFVASWMLFHFGLHQFLNDHIDWLFDIVIILFAYEALSRVALHRDKARWLLVVGMPLACLAGFLTSRYYL